MKYYTGDLHFGHNTVLKFDNRPFKDIDEMDRVLIDNWNSRITKNDQVYILGDLALHNEKPYSWYLSQLKGQKHLIVGNHDRKLLKDSEAMQYFVSVDYYLELTDEKKRLIMSITLLLSGMDSIGRVIICMDIYIIIRKVYISI